MILFVFLLIQNRKSSFPKALRPYYTMRCFTCIFFPCVLDTNMMVSKTRAKHEKNVRK